MARFRSGRAGDDADRNAQTDIDRMTERALQHLYDHHFPQIDDAARSRLRAAVAQWYDETFTW
jgi:hypothetical protein